MCTEQFDSLELLTYFDISFLFLCHAHLFQTVLVFYFILYYFRDIMEENSQLTVAILDTLTNLNLKAELLSEVSSWLSFCLQFLTFVAKKNNYQCNL